MGEVSKGAPMWVGSDLIRGRIILTINQWTLHIRGHLRDYDDVVLIPCTGPNRPDGVVVTPGLRFVSYIKTPIELGTARNLTYVSY